MDELIKELEKILEEKRLAIRATSEEALIITNEETGEEYIIKDLGYPI